MINKIFRWIIICVIWVIWVMYVNYFFSFIGFAEEPILSFADTIWSFAEANFAEASLKLAESNLAESNLAESNLAGASLNLAEPSLSLATSRLALLFLYMESGCVIPIEMLTKVLDILNINVDIYQEMMQTIKGQDYILFQQQVIQNNISDDQIKNLSSYLISDPEINRIVDYKTFLWEYKHFMDVTKITKVFLKNLKDEKKQQALEERVYQTVFFALGCGIGGVMYLLKLI